VIERSGVEGLSTTDVASGVVWTHQVAFMRNPSGDVIYDRRFNTAALLATYYGSNMDFAGRITWDPKVMRECFARCCVRNKAQHNDDMQLNLQARLVVGPGLSGFKV